MSFDGSTITLRKPSILSNVSLIHMLYMSLLDVRYFTCVAEKEKLFSLQTCPHLWLVTMWGLVSNFFSTAPGNTVVPVPFGDNSDSKQRLCSSENKLLRNYNRFWQSQKHISRCPKMKSLLKYNHSIFHSRVSESLEFVKSIHFPTQEVWRFTDDMCWMEELI